MLIQKSKGSRAFDEQKKKKKKKKKKIIAIKYRLQSIFPNPDYGISAILYYSGIILFIFKDDFFGSGSGFHIL